MSSTTPTRVMVTGRPSGGFRMRGQAIAKINGWAVYSPARVKKKRWGCIVLVKNDGGVGGKLRGLCEKLIYDPLDVWMGGEIDETVPAAFWAQMYKELRFTDIIATSPACATTMSGNPQYRVHILPHHADPACSPNWYDPNGPITYSGDIRYLNGEEGNIAKACAALGVGFRLTGSVEGLAGSRAVLALRLGKSASPLNASCKPQIKVENALACRIPVLASPHPCTMSLHPDVLVTAEQVHNWKDELRKVLQAERPTGEYVTQVRYAARLKKIATVIPRKR